MMRRSKEVTMIVAHRAHTAMGRWIAGKGGRSIVVALCALGLVATAGCRGGMRRTCAVDGGASTTPGRDGGRTATPGRDSGPDIEPDRDGGTITPGRDGGTVTPGRDGGGTVVGPGDHPPATCTDVAGSFGGLSMIACVPELDDPSEARPLVVALHGYTQSARSYLETTQWDVLAGRYGFYVVLAQAPGDRSFYWYTTGRDRGQPDPAGIVAMVDRMKDDYAIDSDRVFVNGLSAGGYMAVSLIAGYPDVFAAASVYSGGPHGCSTSCTTTPGTGDPGAVTRAYPTFWSDASARRPRLMLVHGTRDGVNTIGNMASAVRQWTSAIGIDATPDNDALGLGDTLKDHPWAVYTDDAGEIMVQTHTLEGIGHGTPVDPGDAVDQGGYDPVPGTEQPPGYFDPHDWTNTTTFYGPYYSARFFGIAD
jgi:poly(hydroxyalkanoate) depolymerase family esterase